jgi:hypothetical protein
VVVKTATVYRSLSCEQHGLDDQYSQRLWRILPPGRTAETPSPVARAGRWSCCDEATSVTQLLSPDQSQGRFGPKMTRMVNVRRDVTPGTTAEVFRHPSPATIVEVGCRRTMASCGATTVLRAQLGVWTAVTLGPFRLDAGSTGAQTAFFSLDAAL